MIAPATLALLLQACAPTVNPQTQAALVTVESDATAFAVHDNNTDQSYAPHTYGASVLLVEKLLAEDAQRFGARNDGIDVGIAQIDSNNFARYGLTPETALDPCMNLRVGSMMLTSLYDQEYAALAGEADAARQQHALSRALQRYNSGKPTGDQRYVAAVLMAAGRRYVRDATAYATPAVASSVAAPAPQTPAPAQTPRSPFFHTGAPAFAHANPVAPFGNVISHTASR